MTHESRTWPRHACLAALLAASTCAPASAQNYASTATRDAVVARGYLQCAVRNLTAADITGANPSYPAQNLDGLGSVLSSALVPDAAGSFSIGGEMGKRYCKAMAHALLQDAGKVQLVRASSVTAAFNAVSTGLIDVSFRAQVAALQRDTLFKIDPSPPYHYDAYAILFGPQISLCNAAARGKNKPCAEPVDAGNLSALQAFFSTARSPRPMVCLQANPSAVAPILRALLPSEGAFNFLGEGAATIIGQNADARFTNSPAADYRAGLCNVLIDSGSAITELRAAGDTLSSVNFGKLYSVAMTRDNDPQWSDFTRALVFAPMEAESCGILRSGGPADAGPMAVGAVPASRYNSPSCKELTSNLAGGGLLLTGGAYQRMLAITGDWGQLYDFAEASRAASNAAPATIPRANQPPQNRRCDEGGALCASPFAL